MASATITIENRVAAVLKMRFTNNSIALKHYGELLTEYVASGLNTPHLVRELETGDDGKLWSYVWEAMLYRYFINAGFVVRGSSTASGQHGPDFCIEYEDGPVWVEAIVPSPEGIPSDYLEPVRSGEIKVRTKPDRERVLRCTSAIFDKLKQFQRYREKGIVGVTDRAVVALNICRLSDWDIDGNGISQLPLALEAVFPVGPLGVPITPDGELAGDAQHTSRFSLQKSSGSQVATANFLEPAFGSLSAVVQAHQKDVYEKDLSLSVIHNPLAFNSLPVGLFQAHKEFVAEQSGDDYILRDVARKVFLPS